MVVVVVDVIVFVFFFSIFISLILSKFQIFAFVSLGKSKFILNSMFKRGLSLSLSVWLTISNKLKWTFQVISFGEKYISARVRIYSCDDKLSWDRKLEEDWKYLL